MAHLFAENIPTGRRLDTDYAALRQSLTAMMFLAAQRELSQVAIPGYLGCGLAGGDWETVYSRILMPLFSESCFTLTILYLPDSIRRLWTEFGDIPMNRKQNVLSKPGTDFQLEHTGKKSGTGLKRHFRSAWRKLLCTQAIRIE